MSLYSRHPCWQRFSPDLGALLYVTITTGLGLVSTFTSSQVAAVIATTILTLLPTVQFSGMMQPVSTLEGGARLVGSPVAVHLLHAASKRRGIHEGARVPRSCGPIS